MSDRASKLCMVLIDSLFLCLSTGGGGGGCRGAMKSPLATDLLGADVVVDEAVGLLEALGGGTSKLGRKDGEDSAGLCRLLSRESVL